MLAGFFLPACFTALLGSQKNGYWQICPAGEGWKCSRQYRAHTLILETIFENDDGAVRLIDFMPIRERNSDVVRIVEGIRGKVDVRMALSLRFDYGRTVPWVTAIDDGIRAVAGAGVALLHSSVAVHGENLHTAAEFTVAEGERVWFTLTYGESHLPDPKPINPEHALKDTERFWKRWTSQLQYEGDYAEAVERSAITLKAMTFAPTGGQVAAITTSLPENIGGMRNWDYRYCWLRDTTFTLLAMTTAGYYDEACAWQDWLLRAIAGSPDQVQILYGLRGERQTPEWEIDWLPGYEGSRPVRVGNAAAKQLQLDIYGELLDTFYHALHGMERHTEQDFRVLMLLLDHLADIWQRPDEGIWETRGGREQFTYSKMMAWVAFDRAIMIAKKLHSKAPTEKWAKLRDTIHDEICQKAFNKEKNAFVQFYGGKHLDASLLLMPIVGFLPATDPRVRGTIEAIERNLMTGGFVMRYDTAHAEDGLPPCEGAFLACSFWMVSALKAIGRLDDARALFHRLLGVGNDLGLLSEEYDVTNKRLVGNFPQAFSHIALINAAFDLEHTEEHHRTRHRRHTTAARS